MCAAEPTSCNDHLLANPSATDGVYTVDLGGNPVDVYCDMTRNGGGWTLVLQNNIAVTSPAPNWVDVRTAENKTGTFGTDPSLFDMFLGVDLWNGIGTQIRMDWGNTVGVPTNQVIYDFSIDIAGDRSLDLGAGSVTIGTHDTSLKSGPHAGMGLSTFDQDNDANGDGNCATYYENTAFWYYNCWNGESAWSFGTTTGAYFVRSYLNWHAFWVK